MPITKQAIKRVKQDKVKTARNRHYNNDMKSLVRLMLDYVQKGEMDKANRIMPKVIKAIDTCAKKNLFHENNAARKKSRIQKALNSLQKGEVKPAKKEVKPAAKKEAVKKTEKAEKKAPKKTEKKEETKA